MGFSSVEDEGDGIERKIKAAPIMRKQIFLKEYLSIRVRPIGRLEFSKNPKIKN
jgi:hypothetical protein